MTIKHLPNNWLRQLIPALEWTQAYRKTDLGGDIIAGTIVAIMLVPQGMAYALLAGLPAQVGLYASILPLLLYSLLGSSRTLAVGPVAIVSLLVANTIADVSATHDIEATTVGISLALLSGLALLALGVARLGFMVNFISHSVITGFTSGAAIVIALSQLKSLLGFDIPRGNVASTIDYVLDHVGDTKLATLAIGVGATLLLLLWPKIILRQTSRTLPISPTHTATAKSAPLLAVLIGTAIVAAGIPGEATVATVGVIPRGLPSLSIPELHWALWQDLLAPTLVIVFVGFMESVAIAKSLASKRRQKINPNQELIALGAANLGACASGGYPVTGGFSRSVVNFTAGANTPLASVITAGWIVMTIVFLTPLFHDLPRAVLAAIILVAVVPLVDVRAFEKTWRYNKADAAAMIATLLGVLTLGVEPGILLGLALSIVLLLFRTSKPHIAIVGRVGHTEHFRNVQRHSVTTDPSILAVRVDESLYFANTRYLEDYLINAVADAPDINHLVLIMSAVNFVDTSSLESLEALIEEMRDAGITIHLAEVKGPVMDQFARSNLMSQLEPGQVFLSVHDAFTALGKLDIGHATSDDVQTVTHPLSSHRE